MNYLSLDIKLAWFQPFKQNDIVHFKPSLWRSDIDWTLTSNLYNEQSLLKWLRFCDNSVHVIV